ncbi:MAG: hypothetical protein A3I66_23995 [Burkholderiales bacterium RIFCSPLOWO2_02_FULL_57_36]|nr:MAG: hypothetical protein A3I66_23995 [Burkholderiales bacterium RIFCSPLOWO2_02_FULL_57_36]
MRSETPAAPLVVVAIAGYAAKQVPLRDVASFRLASRKKPSISFAGLFPECGTSKERDIFVQGFSVAMSQS